MRLLTTSLCLILLLAACGESNDKISTVGGEKKLTSLQWIDSARNYGQITEGQKLAVSFKFKNSGNSPLIIESVKPSCGCTVADFPREPIAPGAEGEITGEFDSQGREGLQHKQLTVTANTAAAQQNIYFEVNVLPNAKAQQTQ